MLLIYKSSAGSGKTYTLVKEFIRLSLGLKTNTANWQDKYKHILALTFTNKAANEMKSRVIATLDQIAGDNKKSEQLIREFSVEFKVDQAVIIDRAGKILRTILHNYADLSVGTIDSFVHRVIRAFTYDLHLPMSFEVEMDKDKLLTETVDILMDRLDEGDETVTGAIVEYAESNIEAGKGWNLEQSLVNLGRELFVEDAYGYLEKLEAFNLNESRRLRDSLFQFKNGLEQELFEEGKKAMKLIAGSGMSAPGFFQSGRGIYGFFEKYASGEFPADMLGNSYVKKTISEDKWASAKVKPNELIAIEKIKGQLSLQYYNIAKRLEKQGGDYFLAMLLLRNFYSFILLAEIQKLMDEHKKKNNLIHISEFQRMVHAIVKEQDAPVIYERIGDWYDNILIDEHQDTSVLQWQNLLPLIENSLLKNADSLVVGDGKQAIYRFRNGKVEQFEMLPLIYDSDKDARLKEREIVIGNYGTETKQLLFNYRSRKEIVLFNNQFYDAVSGFPEIKNTKTYHQQSQQCGRDEAGGYVSIEFLADGADSTLERNRCLRTFEIIEETCRQGYSYNDIAVLTRSNLNASVLASYLIEKGIPVISSESLLINNSPKVKLILSTLYYFENKDNHIARAEMAYYINLLKAGKAFRFEQFDFRNTEEAFEKDISALLGVPFARSNFLDYQLKGLVQALIRFYRLDGPDPFLQFFSDEVIFFSRRGQSNVREFLEWWEEVKFSKSIIYPETLDAVKISTIHKAKGLQYPVVLLADADWPLRSTKNYFWVDLKKPWLKGLTVGVLPVSKDVLETEFAGLYEDEQAQSFLDMLNLVYVGTTRAEEALYILSSEAGNESVNNNSVTALLVNFLKKQKVWDGFGRYHFGDAHTQKSPFAASAVKRDVYKIENAFPEGYSRARPVIRKTAELLWNDDLRNRLQRGRLVHEIMRKINYKQDAEDVLRRFKAEGLFDEEGKSQLEAGISELLNNEKLSPYFMPPYKIVNERGIGSAGNVRVPDRVVYTGTTAAVIDYKTGEENSDYHYQLEHYAASLRNFGFTEIKKLLVYIDLRKVVEL